MNDKIRIHKELCDGMHQLYRDKNHDYGDSFAKTREIVPGAILVRLHDKLNRLTALLSNPEQAQVKTESIDDTLMDLANYALMELTERRAGTDNRRGPAFKEFVENGSFDDIEEAKKAFANKTEQDDMDNQALRIGRMVMETMGVCPRDIVSLQLIVGSPAISVGMLKCHKRREGDSE